MKRSFTIFILALVLCSDSIFAQSDFKGATSRGTDYWFSFPLSWSQKGSGTLKIYVSCESAVQCTVEIPAWGIRYTKDVKPNEIAEFSLYPGVGQLYEKGDTLTGAKTEQETWEAGHGKGIHVTASLPVTVSGASHFSNSSDSFLALPVSALGKEYMVASYADATANFPDKYLMSQTVIVAAFDNTVVNFKLGGRLGTETVGGLKIGENKSFKLNKGDIVSFANKKINGVYGDISGSKITATKPVAVISGNQCASVDISTPSCDYLAEMELPTMTWGKEYHVTPIINRKKYSFLKIFAKNPNTKLYRDGEITPFAVLTASGGTHGIGYFEGRVLNETTIPRPVVFKADGPISITQYNPGKMDDTISADPFQMVLTPVEQYQKEIIFATPGANDGAGFKDNYVNIVFEADSAEIPDDLEFGTADFNGNIS